MAQLLARMERDRLIRREPDPADGRSSIFSLSSKAKSLINPARAVLAQGNDDALEGFSSEEIATLAALLQRVIGNAKGSA